MSVLIKVLVALEAGIGHALGLLGRGGATAGRAIQNAVRTQVAGLAALSPRVRRGAVAAVVASALGFGAWELRDGPINAYAAAFDKRPLLRAQSWTYQLDRIDVEAMRHVTSDVIVMDFAENGGRNALAAAEVAKMKTQPNGRRRLAISYMSIGEAEHYRWYWKPEWNDPKHAATRPTWLGPANCAWPDNNAVNFWADAWKDIIYRGPKSYIAQVVGAGFDGVYLDRVDIYDQYQKERPTAEAEMVQFVTELAAAARRLNPAFLVIAQNAEDLLRHKHYRRVIDGLGKEDLLHGHDGTGVRNSETDIGWSYDRIKLLLADHKPVIAVEYLVTRESIAEARLDLFKRGIVPTAAHRNLDGSDPTMPRFEKGVAMGTPEWIKTMCVGQKSW